MKLYKILYFLVITILLSSCKTKSISDSSKIEHQDSQISYIKLATKNPEDLKDSIALFEAKNPNIKVRITDYSYEMNTWSKEERDQYNTKLNTELMTGKGADIISMQDLLINPYIDQDILLTLDQFIENDQDFNDSKYYMNIINASKYQDHFYRMPIDFGFRVFLVDNEIVKDKDVYHWTREEFIDFGEGFKFKNKRATNLRQYLLPHLEPEWLFEELIIANYPYFIDIENRYANFTSEEFIQLLRDMQILMDTGIISTSINYDGLYDMKGEGSIAFVPLWGGTHDLAVGRKILSESVRLIHPPLYKQNESKGIFYIRENFAINKHLNTTEESWLFLKYLLSTEAQSMNRDVNSFCVNKEAQAIRNDKQLKAMSVPVGGGKRLKIDGVTDSDISQVDQLIGELNLGIDYNYTMMNILEQEIEGLLYKGKSPKQVANGIQIKANLYLNE